MTEYQSLMLSVCFGATVGMMLGSLICAIKFSIEEHKEKKRRKALEKEQEQENKD